MNDLINECYKSDSKKKRRPENHHECNKPSPYDNCLKMKYSSSISGMKQMLCLKYMDTIKDSNIVIRFSMQQIREVIAKYRDKLHELRIKN